MRAREGCADPSRAARQKGARAPHARRGRYRIAFGDVSSLANCVDAIAHDASVQIVRIHNTMARSRDARASAGFRVLVPLRLPARPLTADAAKTDGGHRARDRQCVKINLCVDCLETRAWGVENHVCEVQLLLSSFAKAQVRLHSCFFTPPTCCGPLQAAEARPPHNRDAGGVT